MALLAVLFALTLLMLLALPFAVSMGVGADAAMRDVEEAQAQVASASLRELLVADAAMSHPSIDVTPTFDGLDEFPNGVELPKAFADLTDGGRVLLGGEVEDLQRKLGLDGASPLLFANVIGVTTRLAEDLQPKDEKALLADASGLPETGVVWIAGELIRYGGKQGNTLLELQRALFQDQLFADGKQPIGRDALVLDYRCVMAAAWPFLRAETGRIARRPYRAPGELLEVDRAGFGGFTSPELDALQRVFSVDTMAATAATWGRPERVFNDLQPDKTKTMMVKSALHLGAGSTVRLRNLRDGYSEYGLVMSTQTMHGGAPELQFPQVFALTLLLPTLATFPATDTVVEPLLPAPVNVNTASEEVLAAICAEVRTGDVRGHAATGREQIGARWVRSTEAQALAADVAALRAAVAADGQSTPFTGWRDLVARLLAPKLEAATSDAERAAWVALYRNLQTGRDSSLEMGTAPLCFQSGPWVAYRAAASRSRSVVAPGVVGRYERTGIAAAMPGFPIERRWATQEAFEDAFQLDRRAPFWVTHPVNLGHPVRGDGNDPAPRVYPHVVPVAYPGLGLGEPRYPATDEVDSGIEPAPASTPASPWRDQKPPPRSDQMSQALDVRGHDVGKQGPYTMVNVGPTGGRGAQPAQNNRHDRIAYPFSTDNGFLDRIAVSAWLQPKSLGNAVLFDYSDGDAERNRLSLQVRDGNLVLEVIDEAGLDPAPGESPAGVQRTASEWTVPTAEIGLPADTPLHVSMSAYAGRPADLSVAVDGVTRGKAKYVTTLTATLKPFDPQLGNNLDPNNTRSERYCEVQVESAEGFPPVGVLRIGLELFEYSSINGNSFRCVRKDSLGGRGARQSGREHRPEIPVDSNGKPTVDIEDPQFQGLNLDVFPEHPVGSQVELYGYSALLSEDSPMMTGATKLDGALGAFAVARGFVDNHKPITVQMAQGFALQVGVGIDDGWSGDLRLADPVPTGNDQPPPDAQAGIADAFPTTGGYALLLQRGLNVRGAAQPGQGGIPTKLGGIEVIRYTSRQGSKLMGVQRAQQVPGDDSRIERNLFDGRVSRFVTNWSDNIRYVNDPQTTLNEYATLIVWVVPISIAVQSASMLWDPQTTGISEWVQLLPRGDSVDTEWVRYDAVLQNKQLVRGNRYAWGELFWTLTRTRDVADMEIGPGGTNTSPTDPSTPPWSPVAETSGYIGYVPRLESVFPQIHEARGALGFRGDGISSTSSHAHTDADVMQCHRLQLTWNNYGAYDGRVGRHDRVALVQGSIATGETRPNPIEWHTVNWQARRFQSDNLQQNQTPPERLGPWPFQLVAFRLPVAGAYLGPARGTVIDDPRRIDRIVKFPSGELPAAYCESPTVGGGVGNVQPMPGLVDEVEVHTQLAGDVVLDEPMTDNASSFTVNRSFTLNSAGAQHTQGDFTAPIPRTGGLVMIDTEILAFQAHADGVFTVAANGRGLLNTQARGHDRGARMRFLTHRPAAILASGVGARDAELPIAAMGAMPARGGTALLGQELLHYAWSRARGEQVALEMPRHYPPGAERTQASARGLFRGRFGTSPQSGAQGEALIAFPFRYWDRHVERSDDPELAYFQLTINEAPVFFRTLRWKQETQDARVEVVCLARADGKLPWEDEPLPAGGLWQLRGGNADTAPHKLLHQASRLEIRFATRYAPGCLDLTSFRAHGWKTTARVEDVRLEYDGQGRVVDELVTAR